MDWMEMEQEQELEEVPAENIKPADVGDALLTTVEIALPAAFATLGLNYMTDGLVVDPNQHELVRNRLFHTAWKAVAGVVVGGVVAPAVKNEHGKMVLYGVATGLIVSGARDGLIYYQTTQATVPTRALPGLQTRLLNQAAVPVQQTIVPTTPGSVGITSTIPVLATPGRGTA